MKAKTTPASRFWLHVRQSDGCWEWQGSISAKGYGRIHGEGRQTGAHRLSWEIHNGPIPTGLLVCHHCDNRRCVRPDHLFLGTAGDNARDMVAKDRHTGALTANDATAIRALYERGLGPALAVLFDVTPQNVRAIRRGDSWKQVA